MTITGDLKAVVEQALDGLRLLDHPFYQRWQDGQLSPSDLKAYSEQYRHFEAALPGFLAGILDQLPEGTARSYVEQNLEDEAGEPSHLELFSTFLERAGGDDQAIASRATVELLSVYKQALAAGPTVAIGGLIAYESQSPGVATTKGECLQRHYGYSKNDTVFWDVHSTLDIEHTDWALSALSETSASPEAVYTGVHSVAQAWWNFLDEREAEAGSITI